MKKNQIGMFLILLWSASAMGQNLARPQIDGALKLRNNQQNQTYYSSEIAPLFEIQGLLKTDYKINDEFLAKINLSYLDSLGKNEKEGAVTLTRGEILYTPLPWLYITLGRKWVSYRDEVIFSANEHNLIPSYQDGMTFNLNFWKIIKVDLFYHVMKQNKEYGHKNEPTTYNVGLYEALDYDFKNLTLNFDFYFYSVQNKNVQNHVVFEDVLLASDSFGTRIGLTPFSLFEMSYEITSQRNIFNELRYHATHRQHFFKIKTKYLDTYKLESEFNYFASDAKYLPHFAKTHNLTGVMNLFRYRNIEGFGLKQRGNFSKNLEMGLQYFYFSKKNREEALRRPNNTEYAVSNVYNPLFIGEEFDLTLNYLGYKNTEIELLTGAFFPGSYFKEAYDSKVQLSLEANLNLYF